MPNKPNPASDGGNCTVIAHGLKGHPGCKECQCYPEGRNDCPDHLKCREWLRTGKLPGASIKDRLTLLERQVADINHRLEAIEFDKHMARATEERKKPKGRIFAFIHKMAS